MFLSYVICFILYLTKEASSNEIDLGNVIFTNILYRHGNRTPVHPYPNDPYKNISYWPTGWGQLTQEGMEGHYELGKWLRSRYGHLLSLDYSKNDIYIQSTDVDRTLMSAYSNLAGLYEPDPSKNWNKNILWSPIPVHTTPETQDMLSGKRPCPQYDLLLSNVMSHPELAKILEENKYVLQAVAAASGSPIETFDDVERVYNTLYIEELFKFPLPTWTNNLYPEPMRSLAGLSFAIPTYTPDMARLKSGPLLADMISHMENRLKDAKRFNMKAWMYSAHDTTIGDVLQALRLYDNQSPPYFSTILVELREKEGNHFVTVFYRNSSLVDPYLLTLPGCTPLCPLKQFKELLTPIIPVDWERECRLSMMQQMVDVTGTSLIAYTLISLTLLLILIITFQRWRKQPLDSDSILYQSLPAEAT